MFFQCFQLSQSLESAQMHNNYLLQDCSNKHKRIILVVPLFTCACDCNVQSSHSVPTDPGLQVFNLKKYFTFPQSKQNLVQALVSVFVEFGSVIKIIYDVSYSSLSLRSSHLFVCFSAEKNCWICGLWYIYMIHELYMGLFSVPVGTLRAILEVCI